MNKTRKQVNSLTYTTIIYGIMMLAVGQLSMLEGNQYNPFSIILVIFYQTFFLLPKLDKLGQNKKN